MIDDLVVPWTVKIPCSRELVEGKMFRFQEYIDAHAARSLLESVMERCPDRYFVAHMTHQEMHENIRDKRMNIVWVIQRWRITFH